MFFESFRITGLAVAQIFFICAIGYFWVRKGFIGTDGLDSMSRLTLHITLPFLIFCQLIRDFDFNLYGNWWLFPLISVAIIALGLGLGAVFAAFISGREHKNQFLTLTTFQNSGYLPLGLVAALLPGDQADTMFIYIFLFLLGFNIVIFSLGVYMLSFSKEKRFNAGSLLNPPVVATVLTLVLIYFGLNKSVPEFIFKPLSMVGDCTLPLSMFVVGGNLALIRLKNINTKAIVLMSLVKLIIMPGLGLIFVLALKLPYLLGLLILIELAVPPATFLSVFIRHYKKEDLLISQGLFFGHALSLITLPIFLSLYFMFAMVK